MNDADRITLNRWRGLTNAQLEELSQLDRRALERDPDGRFAHERRKNVEDRSRCVKLRAQHGITDVFQKVRKHERA